MIWQWNGEQIYHWSKYMFTREWKTMKLRLMKEICKATPLWMSMEISASILWDHGIKSQKTELSTIHSKVTLSCKWSSFVLGRERFLTFSKEFPISLSLHHLIRIAYGKITISLCHFPQTLRTSWNFSRDVKPSLLQPEYWSWPTTLPCIILTCGCYPVIFC